VERKQTPAVVLRHRAEAEITAASLDRGDGCRPVQLTRRQSEEYMHLESSEKFEAEDAVGLPNQSGPAAGEAGGNPHPSGAACMGCPCELSIQLHAALAAFLEAVDE
jgi:hypothetical protein